jgi:hypothetical protein
LVPRILVIGPFSLTCEDWIVIEYLLVPTRELAMQVVDQYNTLRGK